MQPRAEIEPISLSELTSRIEGVITRNLSDRLWVTAEVSECKVNGSSGHCYLSLVERHPQGNAPLAEIRGAIWANRYRLIAAKFIEYTGSEISPGMKLLLRCSVSYHPIYGLSVVVDDVDPAYTLGESERQRQLTIKRLEDEGVIELQKEQHTLPYVVQNLAVISSATAAGYEDFYKQIEQSEYRFEITLYEAMMQGEQTTPSIISALDRILDSGVVYDAVVIIRGGGSASDLRWFDSYDLCFHIAQYPIAILTGIGHEKDVSVADMVAYHYFKTPTAVAAGLIERVGVVDAKLHRLWEETIAQSEQILMGESRRVENLAQELRATTLQIMKTQELRLMKLGSELPALALNIMQREFSRLDTANNTLRNEALFIIQSTQNHLANTSRNLQLLTLQLTQRERNRLEQLSATLLPRTEALLEQKAQYNQRLALNVSALGERVLQNSTAKLEYLKLTFLKLSSAIVSREEARLRLLHERVEGHNPRRILSLGYSITTDSSGQVLKSTEGLHSGETLRVELSDGIVSTIINEITNKRS